MKVVKRSIPAIFMAVVFLIISMVPMTLQVKAADTDVVSIKTEYWIDPVGKTKILNRINQIRKEACDEGVIFNGKKLTPKDFKKLRWSADLEDIAYKRAMEATAIYSKTRPNGKKWNTAFSKDGIKSDAENLGKIGRTMADIEQWYAEKKNLGTGKSTSKYMALINPNFQSVAVASCGATAAEFSKKRLNDESQTYYEPAEYRMNMEVRKDKLDLQLYSFERMAVGESVYLSVTFGNLFLDSGITWTSSKPEVASVNNDGLVTGKSGGTVKITASIAGKTLSATIIVSSPTWRHNQYGWWYDYGDGTYPRSQFLMIDGQTYYFNSYGYMVTGWLLNEGKWYYMLPSGALYHGGWGRINNKWYYFDLTNGVMQTGWLNLNGVKYYLDADGSMHIGWLFINGKWYYMSASGAMATGWVFVNNNWYYLKADGTMAVGWVLDKGEWYFMDASGKMLSKQWITVNGKKYYLTESGKMAKGWVYDKNKWYYTNPDNGAMMTGWVKVKDTWYYLKSTGEMQTGWVTYKNNRYYMSPSGAMVTGWYLINNYWYYFNPDGGAMKTGFLGLNGKKYYLSASGIMQTGWQTISGARYYFGTDGAAYMNGIYKINGANYAFDPEGILSQYVIDYSTRRFHTVNCTLVTRIIPQNRGYSADSRNILIDQGLSPCAHCHP